MVLGDDLQGEARELARGHARDALQRAASGQSVCLLSGGETTVTLEADPGRGGRNTEYALALAIGLGGRPGIWALAADTDGVDGSGGHSGALVEPDTLRRAGLAGLVPEEFLHNHDSASFFERLGGLLAEGPTGTNVNDFRAILVNP
jgi:hydroxypyruvate reductase